MNAHGVDVSVNLSGGRPGAGLEMQLAVAARHPGRLLVFTSLDWSLARLGPGFGQHMADEVRRAHELGAVGIKISKGLGIAYRDHSDQLLAVDSPTLDPIFETAEELGMPVAIHTGDPFAFWQPPDQKNERFAELSVHPEWSFYGESVPSWDELFAQFERRVARHPGLSIIGVHFGNAPEFPDRVDAMLSANPNYYIDTAARIPELGRHPADEMRAFFRKHERRILYGTDLGVGREESDTMLGATGASPPGPADIEHFFAASRRYFETADRQFAHPTPIQGDWLIDGIDLPPATLERIYRSNARELLGLETP